MKPLKLFTPGPLETDSKVKEAMLFDIGSRDVDLVSITRRIREDILALANATSHYTCIPLQGSGTFGMEAAIGTFIGKHAKCLVLINGIYGQRITKILEKNRIEYEALSFLFTEIPDLKRIEKFLDEDKKITHALFVYCETTTGIVNPLDQLVDLFRRYKVVTVIDAVSAFGALPLDARKIPFDVLVTSSNKCLESVPGISLTLARVSLLKMCRQNSPSFCLDLYEQWQMFERTGQWRFTPPTHVLQALGKAIEDLLDETIEGRYKRYARNKDIVIQGLEPLGLKPCVNQSHQSPICLAFSIRDLTYLDFEEVYQGLKDNGVLIYHTLEETTESFRVGCIGRLSVNDFKSFIVAFKNVIHQSRSKRDCLEITEEVA